MKKNVKSQNSMGRNIIFNLLKTMVTIIFPLITFPYASRILQVNCIGRYSFSLSVVNYFSLIAASGIQTYAIREGAKIRNNKNQMNILFTEIFVIHILLTIFAYFMLFIGVSFIPKLHNYRTEILIISVQIILLTLSLNWVYTVFEDFIYITIVSFILQSLTLVGLLLFVHSPKDLYIYITLSMIASYGYGIFSFIHAKKYIKFEGPLKINTKHIKPIFTIFISTIAIMIYVSSDETMIGWMNGDYEVGLYSTASKIYLVVKQILNAIVSVMLPRITFYLGNNNYEDAKKLGNDILDGMTTLCFPAMIGLMVMSKEIITVYAGKSYIEASGALTLLGIALVFAVFSNILVNCILIALHHEKLVMKATIFSAILNIILNFILIPSYGFKAAAFTTIVAEVSIMFICLRKTKELIQLRIDKSVILSTLIGCLIIISLCLISKRIIDNNLYRLVFAITSSSIVYTISQIIFKNKFVYNIIIQYINKPLNSK